MCKNEIWLDVYLRPWPPGWSFLRRIYTSRGSERVNGRVETICLLVISNSSSSNERIFEYFRILDRKVVANPIFKIPTGQEVKYTIP